MGHLEKISWLRHADFNLRCYMDMANWCAATAEIFTVLSIVWVLLFIISLFDDKKVTKAIAALGMIVFIQSTNYWTNKAEQYSSTYKQYHSFHEQIKQDDIKSVLTLEKMNIEATAPHYVTPEVIKKSMETADKFYRFNEEYGTLQ